MDTSMPPPGPLRDAWHHGARVEAFRTTEGMSHEAREVYELVQVLAQQGHASEQIVRDTAVIFSCDWPWRARLRLALEVLESTSSTSRRQDVTRWFRRRRAARLARARGSW